MSGSERDVAPLLTLRNRALLHADGLQHELSFKYRRGLALLGFLAAHPNRVFQRETLADMLWPHLEVAAGRANLRGVLLDVIASLRLRGLADALDSQRDSLTWRPAGQLVTDMEWLVSARTSPVGSEAQARMLTLIEDAAQGRWMEGTEEGASEDFCEWLTGRRAEIDSALERFTVRSVSAAASTTFAAEPGPYNQGLAMARLVALTLLRIDLGDITLDSDQPLALPDDTFTALCAHAEHFDGALVTSDDLGCTFGFGIDGRLSDQRWQALRCAVSLPMLPAMARSTLRIGLTSGRVLLVNEPALRVVGSRVRWVESLARQADAGELACDESLADIVPGWGHNQDMPRLLHPGPIETGPYRYACSSAQSLWCALPPGGDLPQSLFGRSTFLHGLMKAIDHSVAGAPAALCIAGAPGAGKTRTALACAQQLQASGAPVFWIGAQAAGQSLPWRGLHDLVKGLLASHGHAAAPQADMPAAGLGGELARLTPGHWRVLNELTTVRNVSARDRHLLPGAVAALLWHDGSGAPPLVVIDDAPWLDVETAGVLSRIASERAGTRWLLTCRSGAMHPLSLPDLWTSELDPLDDGTALAILESLPDASSLTTQDRRRRIANARGLPLYLLADSISLERSSHFAEFCGALLHRLHGVRAGIDAAAMLGMLFSVDDLAVLCGPEMARRTRESGIEAGLMMARGADQAAFFHPRLREYLMSVMPAGVLRHHVRAAAAVHGGQGRHAQAGSLWEQAGEPLKAGRAWFMAAQQSLAEDDNWAACDHCGHVARLGYLAGEEGVVARVFHARCLIARHGHSSVEVRELSGKLDALDLPDGLDPDLVFDMGVLAYLASSEQAHVHRLDHAIRLEAHARTTLQRFTARWATAHTLFWLGDFAAARVTFAAQLEIGKDLDAAARSRHLAFDLSGFARAEMAWALWYIGDAAESAAVIDAAIANAEASTQRHDLCIACCFAGLIAWCVGDQPRMVLMATRAMEVGEAEGLQFWHAVARLLIMLTRAYAGQVVDVRDIASGVATVMTGHTVAAAAGIWMVSDALIAGGRHEEALTLLDRVLDQIGTTENFYYSMDLWRLKGMAHDVLGDKASAAVAAQRSLQQGAQARALGWLARWSGPMQALARIQA